jgi:hypothetical protein
VSPPNVAFSVYALGLILAAAAMNDGSFLVDLKVYLQAGGQYDFGPKVFYGPTSLFVGPPWVAWAASWLTWMPAALGGALLYVASGAALTITGERLTQPRAVILALCLLPSFWLGQLAPLLVALFLLGLAAPTIGWPFLILLVLLKPSWLVVVVAVLLGCRRLYTATAVVAVLAVFMLWNIDGVIAWSHAIEAHKDFVHSGRLTWMEWSLISRFETWWMPPTLVLIAWACSTAIGSFTPIGDFEGNAGVTRLGALIMGVATMPWLMAYDALALFAVGLVFIWNPTLEPSPDPTTAS